MNFNIGHTALLLALICSLYAIVSARVYINTNKYQWIDSARNAVITVWFLLTLACLILVYLLTNEHFEIEYVASVSSRAMPWYLKATALWGGQAGSLLFWSWLMSTYTGIVMLRDWSKEHDMQPYVITASMLTLAFFISLNVFVENPFNVLWIDSFGNITASVVRPDANLMFTPKDGTGLNPLLRHPGMIIHPPMLYLGFVGFVIPYSFAIGALAVGRTDSVWIRSTRRWTLIAWLFLSLGLLLGGRWAYDVLGWGGYWGWDPVEIAAFMPWLTGTAFLHSVIIQEKHGMFKRWNMILIILTYSLVIFGTFLTRSGVLSSVHAFAQSSIGPLFFILLSVAALSSSISLLEPGVAYLSEEGILSRGQAAMVISFFVWMLGIGSALSFNIWSDFHLISERNFLDSMDFLANQILLPLGGMLIAIFVGLFMKESLIKDEIGAINPVIYNLWRFFVKFILLNQSY